MRIKTTNDIGLIIRDRRNKLGLTQQALAVQIGTTRQRIAALESGKPNAAIDLLLRVAHIIGLEVSIQPQSSPDTASTDLIPEYDIEAIVTAASGRTP